MGTTSCHTTIGGFIATAKFPYHMTTMVMCYHINHVRMLMVRCLVTIVIAVLTPSYHRVLALFLESVCPLELLTFSFDMTTNL